MIFINVYKSIYLPPIQAELDTMSVFNEENKGTL